MFKTFKIALLALLLAGNGFAADAYQFVDNGNWEQFSWGQFSSRDILLSGPSSVVIKSMDNLSSSGIELFSTLVDKANYISVSDFSTDSQIAFLRVTADKLPDDQKHNFTCEIGTYSSSKGLKIVDTWQTKREYYESSSNCSVGATFLSNGTLAYVKRTDSQVLLDLIDRDGNKKEILVKVLPNDGTATYGYDSLPIENTSTKTIAFHTFPGAGVPGDSVFYTLGAAAVTLGKLNADAYRGQHSPIRLLDNNDLANSFGIVATDGKLKSKFKRSFVPNFFSRQKNLYIGDGDSPLLNGETSVVLKDNQLLPLGCVTGQTPPGIIIKSVIDEGADGSLLVIIEDKEYFQSLALLQSTGSPLDNTRCAVITHELSKECASAYRKSTVQDSYRRKAKQLPKAATCNFSLQVKSPEGEPLNGIKGEVVLETGLRVYRRFSTNGKGKSSIMLPMRAFAKNQEGLTIAVKGRESGFQNLAITIINFIY